MPNDPNPNPNPNGPEPKPGEGGDQGDQGAKPGGNGPQGDQGSKPGEGGNDPSAELSAERTARAAAEKRATDAEAEAARLRRSNAAQKPGDLDALRGEIRQEFTGQLVRAEIRAAAAGRLRDPADALALVDVAELVGEGGDVDMAAITAAVDQLIKDKPYLAADSAASPAPWGDVGSGQRGSTDPKDEPSTPFDRLRDAYGTAG
ncbi:hypothetical protein [Streptomyces sp. MUM 178J]|uniref:hypothetical protein n=1 Tax=Streptomyces sp. MUM 178J TaxID=2791991 RepID=UPI001F033C63|nr:hypothetical protein [Streptomyces sp. MUM 178J]WRQ81656.1 hypothetical protein I3F59_021135 [Streptomyces sp. MUM 178J]